MNSEIFFLVLALIALATVPVHAGEGDEDPYGVVVTADYDCGGGEIVTVTWWYGEAVAKVGGEVWKLTHALSASGARYSDGTHEIWEHQGILRVTEDVSDKENPIKECPYLKDSRRAP